MTLTTEQRLQRLEDGEQIRTITAKYAEAVDRGYLGQSVDAAALEQLFEPDARWTCVEAGYDLVGRDAVIAALVESPVTFAMHSFTNPIINLDSAEGTANASWTLWVALDQRDLRLQTEHITYKRRTGGWAISWIDVHVVRR